MHAVINPYVVSPCVLMKGSECGWGFRKGNFQFRGPKNCMSSRAFSRRISLTQTLAENCEVAN